MPADLKAAIVGFFHFVLQPLHWTHTQSVRQVNTRSRSFKATCRSCVLVKIMLVLHIAKDGTGARDVSEILLLHMNGHRVSHTAK